MPDVEYELRYDLRNPLQWQRPWPELYEHFLTQVQWADDHGFDAIHLNEHHFSDDGYLPSPVVMAAAVAARTSTIAIRLAVVIVPLKHPVQLAEELAVLDHLSNGRVEIILGAGYRAEEFDGYGIDLASRPGRVEEGLEIIRLCWTEDEFDFEGRYWQLRGVRCTPKPLQQPHPALVLGGSSRGAARRAARLADGFAPTDLTLLAPWEAEMRALGKDPRPQRERALRTPVAAARFLHVAKDPGEATTRIAAHLEYVANAYAGWTSARDGAGAPLQRTAAELLDSPGYAVLTPEQVLTAARECLDNGVDARVTLQPMFGAIADADGQDCLELVASEVMPFLPRRPDRSRRSAATPGTRSER